MPYIDTEEYKKAKEERVRECRAWKTTRPECRYDEQACITCRRRKECKYGESKFLASLGL